MRCHSSLVGTYSVQSIYTGEWEEGLDLGGWVAGFARPAFGGGGGGGGDGGCGYIRNVKPPPPPFPLNQEEINRRLEDEENH